MREIKFRAYYKPKEDKKYEEMSVGIHEVAGLIYKEWVGGFVSDSFKVNVVTDNGGFLVCTDEEIELMQYIGLKDKNGKEIYEGDVVRREKMLYEVCYHYPSFGIYPRSDKWNSLDYDNEIISFHDDTDDNETSIEFEVIGNIYENPKLI